MARKFSLESVLTMTDRITGPMRKAANNVVGFSRKMRNQFNGMNSSIARVNRNINKMAKSRLFTGGLLALGAGVGLVTREYVKFDDAIFGATARFVDAQKEGANVNDIMEKLRKTARKVGAETQFTAAQMAQGLDFFARAGFTSVEAMKSLRSVVDLATVSGEDFARVSDISSDLLGSFGFQALKSAEKVKKLKDMNNLLAIAVNSSNVKLEDLFETLKIVGPVSKIAGANMRDMIAVTALLGGAGIKGTLASTAIKNIFLRLGEFKKPVEKAFNSIGLGLDDIKDKAGNMKPITEILKKVTDNLKGVGTHKQLQVMGAIFGKRAISGAKNIGELTDKIGALSAKMLKMGNFSKKAAEFMRQSLGNRLKVLMSAANEVGFKFLEAFDGKGRKGIDSLTKAVQKFDPSPIIKSLKVVFAVMAFGWKIISPFLPFIVALIVAVKVYIGVVKLVAVVTKVWAIAQGVLTAVMTPFVWPILAVIAAIAALITITVLLVKNWDKIKETFKDNLAFKGLLVVIEGVNAKLKQMATFIKIVGALLSGDFNKMKSIAVQSNQFLTDDEKKKALSNYRSPGTQKSETTTTNKSKVDVNFNNAPEGTEVKQSGNTGPIFDLNLGVNPQ